MQVRVIGAADLIGQFEDALAGLGFAEARRYPSHRGPDVRLYVTIDDRHAGKLLALLATHVTAVAAENKARAYRTAGMYQPREEPDPKPARKRTTKTKPTKTTKPKTTSKGKSHGKQ